VINAIDRKDFIAPANSVSMCRTVFDSTYMDLLALIPYEDLEAGIVEAFICRIVTGKTIEKITRTLEAAPPTQSPPQDAVSAGPTMPEAMQDQLGIKLKPARAVVSVLVIDHVEQPTEN
jgi:hypothetical protein